MKIRQSEDEDLDGAGQTESTEPQCQLIKSFGCQVAK